MTPLDFSLGPYPSIWSLLWNGLYADRGGYSYNNSKQSGMYLEAVTRTLRAIRGIELSADDKTRSTLVRYGFNHIDRLYGFSAATFGRCTNPDTDRGFGNSKPTEYGPPYTILGEDTGGVANGIADFLVYLKEHPPSSDTPPHDDQIVLQGRATRFLKQLLDPWAERFTLEAPDAGYFWYSFNKKLHSLGNVYNVSVVIARLRLKSRSDKTHSSRTERFPALTSPDN